jgi:hypothetical protein
MKVRVMLAGQLIEALLQRCFVNGQPPGQPEDLEVVHVPPTTHVQKCQRARLTGPVGVAVASPGYAENDVPHPQLDLALGFTNVKPLVNPCLT